MKAKALFALLATVVVALLLWVALRPVPPASYAVPAAPPPEDDGSDWFSPPPGTGATAAGPAETPEEPYDEFDLDPAAIASLRGGREFGDPRTPPIGRDAPREQATPEELADPEKYAEFEARQERKIKRAYVIEAEKYVAQLREDIEKGKTMGIPPEEIAKVEEKVRRIEEMRAKLLAADPGLATAAGDGSGDTAGR